MSKTYRFAGVSRRAGSMKARFANDQMRVKVLAKTGSSDIDLIELEHPMTKEAALEFLLKINFDNGNAEVRAALEEGLAKRTPKATKPKAAKAKAPAKKAATKTKAKPTMDSIKAKAKAAKAKETAVSKAEVLAQLEDAPF
jgi:hypothetical protein